MTQPLRPLAVPAPGPAVLAEIAALEREVVAADGGRLKLEHGVLARRDPAQVRDWVVHEDDRLVAYAGLHHFGGAAPELVGMVAPDRRRVGHGSALLAAARPVAAALSAEPLLLVTPTGSPSGQAFALTHGGRPDHSEHHLVLGATPDQPQEPAVSVRTALEADRPLVAQLLSDGFGQPVDPAGLDLAQDPVLLVELEDRPDHGAEPVAALRVERTGDRAGIYGFVVRSDLRGRGIGRAVLARTCRALRAEGCAEVVLEVAVDNPRALELYLATGFVVTAGEDYWALPPR